MAQSDEPHSVDVRSSTVPASDAGCIRLGGFDHHAHDAEAHCRTMTLPRITSAALRNAGRMTVAALVAAGLATLSGLPQGYWAVITAMVIMQGSLGGTLGAASDRVLATMAGAIAGAIGAWLQAQLALPQLLLLALVTSPLSLLVVIRPSFRLAPVTAAIILMSGTAEEDALQTAWHRTLEIGIGCIVGVLTAHLVLPSRARSVIMANAPAVLEKLGQLAQAYLTRNDAAEAEALGEQVRRHITALATALEEDRRERAAHLAAGPDATALLRTLRRLRSDVAIIGRAMALGQSDTVDCARIASAVRAQFDAASACLRGTIAPPGLEALDAVIDAVPESSTMRFALATLRRELDELNERMREQAAG